MFPLKNMPKRLRLKTFAETFLMICGAYPVYARSPSPSQRPAPSTIASRSPFPLGFSLSIIPKLMVLSFFFNSRILQTGILQTGPNQFVENQKQIQDNKGLFGRKNLPERLEFFCRSLLFPFESLLECRIDEN